MGHYIHSFLTRSLENNEQRTNRHSVYGSCLGLENQSFVMSSCFQFNNSESGRALAAYRAPVAL